MKILIIGQLPVEVGGTYTTGVCNVVYELSKCNSDIQQYVYATNISEESAKKINGLTTYLGTKFRYLNVLWNIFKNPLQTFKQWKYYSHVTHMSPVRCEFYKDNFTRVIKIVKPDLIHCMNIFQMAPLYFASKKYKTPIVLTLHGVFYNNNKKLEDLFNANIKLANYTTGLTPETIYDISNLGFPINKIYMIPNGVDTTKFYFCNNERSFIREELGIDNETTLMITVGSLQTRKGQLSFCKILKSLPREFKYKYCIIGLGPDKELIEKYLISNGLEDKVIIIGYVKNSDLYRYYSAADIYVHCSFAEGQALSEVEAYATDLKIALNKDIIGTVVTDTNNNSDYFIFDFNKFDSFKFAQWARLHKENRKTRKQYDWEHIYFKYIKLYKDILKG